MGLGFIEDAFKATVGLFDPVLSIVGLGVGGIRDARSARKDAQRDREAMRAAVDRAEAEAIQRAGARNVLAQRALRKNSLFTGGGDSGGGRSTLGV